MITSRWLSILLALLLLVSGGAIIIYISLFNREITQSSNVTLIMVLFGLSLTTFAALTLILREIAIRLREESTRTAREQALAEHRRFLRRLDHELKNPVTSLRAGLGSLILTAPPPQVEIARTLDSAVIRLSHLVADLRKLAELEAGTLEVHAIVFGDLIEEIVALDEERIVAQGRHFRLDNRLPAGSKVTFMGDQNLLQLAVHNLLDNALKYTRPDDTITLQTGMEDDMLVIRVHDTGSGIAPDDLELVWEELYRGQNKGDLPGYGIGLALVKSIVEQHDGAVTIESAAKSGTTVTIRLPCD